jgi:hypothetical protein
MFFGYIPNLNYIGPNSWNEFKTNINLDCIKTMLIVDLIFVVMN